MIFIENINADMVERALHLIAVLVFALSGALAAAWNKQTFVTFAFFAILTGVGGGTVRDILIGAPVFWVNDSLIIALCIFAALLIWFVPAKFMPARALDWCDALGMAAYSVFGAGKALAYGVSPIPAIIMGIITACIGGVIRDILAGEPSIIMRPEIYVSASALAAALFVVIFLWGVPIMFAAAIGASAGFILRAAAIQYGLGLPTYKK
ncbi:hypothetical protein LPB140_02960 [Sphingorhabdus lutea]|uniref:Glycine transporter domain-containing protein n=1 Tax=Sphingorhabdus lutea TaxID=1913578 RepID=A0A1L3JEF1_9SPHN|nr:trimeric intracellular cation channel family protein [Sphingorhabdus lutea]APG63512.1 hypothetical protein LPB140_02960 [Sphingorhabdus lutea]